MTEESEEAQVGQHLIPTVAGVVLLGLALVAAVWTYQRSSVKATKSKTRPKSWADELISSKGNSRVEPNSDSGGTGADGTQCVWEERRKKGIELSSNQKAKSVDGKPFGSSYYYAHNNQNSTGGYKDGLRMEDYTMNQPRLLSRGGKQVNEDSYGGKDPSPPTQNDTTVSVKPPPRANKVEEVTSKKRVIPITRYMWDDPGDLNGEASIRIDSVPHPSGNGKEPIPWKEIGVTDTSAKLEDDGLLVTVNTELDVDYRLHIVRLYGSVAKVTLKAKEKRLVVKLQKKKGLLVDKANLKSWPHPNRKSS